MLICATSNGRLLAIWAPSLGIPAPQPLHCWLHHTIAYRVHLGTVNVSKPLLTCTCFIGCTQLHPRQGLPQLVVWHCTGCAICLLPGKLFKGPDCLTRTTDREIIRADRAVSIRQVILAHNGHCSNRAPGALRSESDHEGDALLLQLLFLTMQYGSL